MSSTRRTKEGNRKPQEAFCSSVEYESGLLANIVAQRCQVLTDAGERELVFALQYYSWQPGGLDKLAADLLAAHPGECATPAMRQIGTKPGQVYNARQVEQVRAEIPGGEWDFRLRGEVDELHMITAPDGPRDALDNYTGDWKRERESVLDHAKRRAQKHPVNYPAEVFEQHCRQAAADLGNYLANLCLDPKCRIVAPWYCPRLIPLLQDYIRACGQAVRAQWAETEITRRVNRALDYAMATGEMTPIYGDPRLGKSEAAKAWCAERPGRARYVQVPSGNDDVGLFRRVAEAYGVASSLSLKSVEIRERIEKVARAAGLMIVFDEAHKLLGDAFRIYRRPSRIAWVINELVNYGVPVALVTTGEFDSEKRRIEKQTGWSWSQFDGRIGIPEILPKELSQADLAAVARSWLPEGDAAAIKALVGYALFTTSQIAGIKHAVTKARYEARLQGRTKLNLADIKSAIESRLPVDVANPAPEAASPKPRFGRRAARIGARVEAMHPRGLAESGPVEAPLQPGCRETEPVPQSRNRLVPETALAGQ